MSTYNNENKENPWTGKTRTIMVNKFVTDVAVRGIVRARERYQLSIWFKFPDAWNCGLVDADWNMGIWETTFMLDEQWLAREEVGIASTAGAYRCQLTVIELAFSGWLSSC